MTEDGFERLETMLGRLTKATEDGFSATTSYLGVVKAQLALFVDQLSLLDTRMTLIEEQMVEVLGRLRIIGEQLATHSHGEAA